MWRKLMRILMVIGSGVIGNGCGSVAEGEEWKLGMEEGGVEGYAVMVAGEVRVEGEPVVYRMVRGEHPDTGEVVRMDVVIFDGRRVEMRVVDQGSLGRPVYVDLAEAMVAEGALAGVNGGYFHPDGRPLGMMVVGGEEVNRIESGSSLVGGVLWDDGREVRVQRVGEYLAGRTSGGVVPRNLVQAGPFLVDGGRSTAGLEDQRRARRTILLSDGAGRFAIGRVESITLNALGRMLVGEGLLPGFRVKTALNLDGGRSTALWVGGGVAGTGGEVRYWAGGTTVRNLIALKMRDQGR